MTPWLSIVVPTSGRRHPELFRTLRSIREQRHAGVEVLVVADVCGALSDRSRFDILFHDIAALREPAVRWLEYDGGTCCYGQPQRSFGARQAAGEWVAFSQDDNILTEGAIQTMWMALCQEPHKRPLFFRILTPWREQVWRTPQLVLANIDADCIVLPHQIAQQTTWGMRYEGDYDAAVHAFNLAGGDVGWREEQIAIARPEQEHIWW